MAKLVSTTYGDALFDLALEEDRIPEFKREVTDVRQICIDNQDLLTLLDHPRIAKEEKLAFIDKVFGGRASGEMVGFLRIIVEKDRQEALIPIFDHFLYRVREHEGTGTARVTSAVVLTADQKKAVEEKLLKTTKYDSLDIDYVVAPEILGGLVIRIGDRIVDSSLKTQVEELSRQLSRNQTEV
jgi:F-type H+-transporting ATPase subunit delta